jgi:hypothetical protein
MQGWTYSGDPGRSAKDATRLIIGDTDPSDPLLTDLEIEYFLGLYNNAPINAGIRCCEAIMTKFARMADESVGSVKITFSQKNEAYRKMKGELQQRVAIEGAIPFCGGISVTQVRTTDQNTDRVRPDFTKHMMENDLIAPWTTDPFGVDGDQALVEGE